jgi:hypothetical protein
MGGERVDDGAGRFGGLVGRGHREVEEPPDLEPAGARLRDDPGGLGVVRDEIAFAQLMVTQKATAVGAGAPVGELESVGGLAFTRRYAGGSVWFRRDLGARWLAGPVLAGYLAAGAAGGELGLPTTDVRPARDGVGRRADFEHGTVVHRPDIGPAAALTGPVHAAWVALGADDWAYPYSAPVPLVGGWGRCVHFRAYRAGGSTDDVSIYWTPATGAHPVHGDIRARWAQLGWEESYLGFPVTAELPWDDPESARVGRVQHFERGAIAWNADDRAVIEYPERIVVKSGPIGVSSVGGWIELILTSAGTYTFRGHLHNSGFAGLHCTVGGQLGFTGAVDQPTFLRVKKNVHVGGTASFDGRDEDWSDDGYDGSVRLLWPQLRASAWRFDTGVRADIGAADFFLLILAPLAGAVAVISLAFGGPPPPDTQCTTSHWHTTTDGNNNTVYEPQGVRCQPR